MTTTYVVLILLAVWRLARLVTADFITEPIRAAAARRGEKLGYLFECPWCLSIWLAPIVVAPAVAWPGNRVIFAAVLILAASGAAGLMATIEDRLDR